MKKWMLLGALALTGCTQINQYQQAVKTPAPANLQGYWQTTGPQHGLISDRALGSLIITAEGDTLDCRQWQRVIAKPGKLTLLNGEYVNVNKQLRVMPLELDGNELRYDKLTLKKMDQPTIECQQALEQVALQPDAAVIRNIEPQNMRAVFAPQPAESQP
ncbi:hypothetical protein COO59_15890 [Mixta theicola]|uniref:Lipoprotein n=1 Tax=Mixta theicola TaxID=1458355 RepID=A0A2K1Q6F2_9GAMM|nr:lipoprotein YedD [Mixta theicola]PNS10605.1 hypothetical protein COO59_15890 [Mixta theicola]GLR11018.1 lipoprotein [Mixta theicola]